jgi:PAS domain S-box-containing protein
MKDEDKPKEQLIEELNELRARVAKLEMNQLTHQDKLKLAIVNRAPFTLWACDRNFRIVLWNDACEQIYGIREHDALSKDFVDLFVDAPEQEQSRKDCLRVIEQNKVFSNFLAYDLSRDGNRRTMLTNCFRIWDQDTQQHLQAEVALEISDLELRKNEHRNLREVGIARLEEKKRLFSLTQRELSARIVKAYSARMRVIDDRQRSVEQYRTKIVRSQGEAVANEITVDQLQQVQQEREALQGRQEDLFTQLFKADKLDELQELEEDIIKFERGEI